MLKKIVISILVALVIIFGLIYVYRYQILRYSAETLIRAGLPHYIKIERIGFDFKSSRIIFGGFCILNPPDFSYGNLLEIEEITAKYRVRGKSIMEGFEISEPTFKQAVLNIERLGNGATNLAEMRKFTREASKETSAGAVQTASKPKSQDSSKAKLLGDKALPDIIKLPQEYFIKEGKIIFIDRLTAGRPAIITLENIDAALALSLNESYTEILSLGSGGAGRFNGKADEVIKWNCLLNPTTPKLTMSNKFEVSNIDFLVFEPYYDKYSPLVFKKGRLSGTLIFDFDNGNIGSMNEVYLKDILFYIKRGYETAEYLETTVQDLVRYFTSSQGEIIFDFKIKGDMSAPKVYLGPISKRAVASMAIEKISGAIEAISEPKRGDGAKSNADKAQEYIGLFKELINKKGGESK